MLDTAVVVGDDDYLDHSFAESDRGDADYILPSTCYLITIVVVILPVLWQRTT